MKKAHIIIIKCVLVLMIGSLLIFFSSSKTKISEKNINTKTSKTANSASSMSEKKPEEVTKDNDVNVKDIESDTAAPIQEDTDNIFEQNEGGEETEEEHIQENVNVDITDMTEDLQNRIPDMSKVTYEIKKYLYDTGNMSTYVSCTNRILHDYSSLTDKFEFRTEDNYYFYVTYTSTTGEYGYERIEK